MEVSQVLHMNGGVGEASYANNSLVQQHVISLTKHIREEAITGLNCSNTLPRSFAIAGMGCSSGPNTLLVVPCNFFGVPGSFYGRVFPNQSLHFVHSSYSLQWLSKVPEGVDNNKGNIYMASSRWSG